MDLQTDFYTEGFLSATTQPKVIFVISAQGV